MKAERLPEGRWLASGNGPLRRILSEADTRREAVRSYSGMWRDQAVERRRAIDSLASILGDK